MKILIGLTGKKNSGKDTVADLLVEHFYRNHIIVRLPFANALKAELARLTGGSIEEINAHKNEPMGRRLLQFIGQEAKILENNEHIWLNKVRDEYLKLKDRVVLIPDVRYEFEAAWVKSERGLLIRVFRPVADSVEDNHSSETEVNKINFDFSVMNDGTLEDLKRNVKWLAQHIKDHYKI